MKLIRARYVGEAFKPLEPVDLAEGTEVLLGVDDRPQRGSWRDLVSFCCTGVAPLFATFSWFLPGPGPGVPRVKACHLLEDGSGGTRVVARISPAPGTLHVEQTIPLVPAESARRLEFGLRFVDVEGGEHLVDEILVRVPPTRVVFQDLPGGPAAPWVREGSWGRLDSGIWADSPVGDYANNSDFSLTTPLISLGGLERTVLAFEERHSLEEGSDFCHVEVQGEDGPWARLASYTGTSSWTSRRFDLAAYDGTRIRVRFRLVSDRSVTRDGFFVRQVVLAGSTSS